MIDLRNAHADYAQTQASAHRHAALFEIRDALLDIGESAESKSKKLGDWTESAQKRLQGFGSKGIQWLDGKGHGRLADVFRVVTSLPSRGVDLFENVKLPLGEGGEFISLQDYVGDLSDESVEAMPHPVKGIVNFIRDDHSVSDVFKAREWGSTIKDSFLKSDGLLHTFSKVVLTGAVVGAASLAFPGASMLLAPVVGKAFDIFTGSLQFLGSAIGLAKFFKPIERGGAESAGAGGGGSGSAQASAGGYGGSATGNLEQVKAQLRLIQRNVAKFSGELQNMNRFMLYHAEEIKQAARGTEQQTAINRLYGKYVNIFDRIQNKIVGEQLTNVNKTVQQWIDTK